MRASDDPGLLLSLARLSTGDSSPWAARCYPGGKDPSRRGIFRREALFCPAVKAGIMGRDVHGRQGEADHQ